MEIDKEIYNLRVVYARNNCIVRVIQNWNGVCVDSNTTVQSTVVNRLMITAFAVLVN